MSKLTKEQVGIWITELIPFVKNPMLLSPKGCFKGEQEVKPGKIIEYDAALLPREPKFLTQAENLKVLVELYKICEE